MISTGAKIVNKNSIHIKPWIEGQDLIASVDLVIAKCGYSTISECLTSGTPFLYLYDKNHQEQKAIIKELHKIGIKNEISMDKLNNIKFSEEFISKLPIYTKEKNATNNVVRTIMKIIN